MGFREDMVPTTPPVLCRAENDDGEVYFIKIAMEKEEAAVFLSDMWKAVDGAYFPVGDDALREWTDRMRDVRSSVDHEGVCIRTHGWHPSRDRSGLHRNVIDFLRSRGF